MIREEPGGEPRQDGLEYRQFAADATLAQCRDWMHAVHMGFYQSRASPAHVAESLTASQADGRIFTGVYDHQQTPDALSPDIPVATYATMQHFLNVGAGAQLPVHQITSVTVRPTHRRRGILRQLITEDMKRAASAGLAVAALTASEATIYGRFGFGASTFLRSVEVDTGPKFRIGAPATGRVELIEPAQLRTWAPEIFDHFQAERFGSLGRQYAYAQRVSGLWGQEKPEPDPEVRAALYRSGAGHREGYVSYRFEGWDKPKPSIRVDDLVAVTPDAYRELWRFLGSLDLVAQVHTDFAPVDDPLPWLLTDRRVYAVTGERDHLWLRILDTAAALEARHWGTDGVLTLRVHDALGFAEGIFRIEAANGRAVVTEVERVPSQAGTSEADVELDASALASLYLGAPAGLITALASAGSMSELRPGGIRNLEQLFATSMTPYCITGF